MNESPYTWGTSRLPRAPNLAAWEAERKARRDAEDAAARDRLKEATEEWGWVRLAHDYTPNADRNNRIILALLDKHKPVADWLNVVGCNECFDREEGHWEWPCDVYTIIKLVEQAIRSLIP